MLTFNNEQPGSKKSNYKLILSALASTALIGASATYFLSTKNQSINNSSFLDQFSDDLNGTFKFVPYGVDTFDKEYRMGGNFVKTTDENGEFKVDFAFSGEGEYYDTTGDVYMDDVYYVKNYNEFNSNVNKTYYCTPSEGNFAMGKLKYSLLKTVKINKEQISHDKQNVVTAICGDETDLNVVNTEEFGNLIVCFLNNNKNKRIGVVAHNFMGTMDIAEGKRDLILPKDFKLVKEEEKECRTQDKFYGKVESYVKHNDMSKSTVSDSTPWSIDKQLGEFPFPKKDRKLQFEGMMFDLDVTTPEWAEVGGGDQYFGDENGGFENGDQYFGNENGGNWREQFDMQHNWESGNGLHEKQGANYHDHDHNYHQNFGLGKKAQFCHYFHGMGSGKGMKKKVYNKSLWKWDFEFSSYNEVNEPRHGVVGTTNPEEGITYNEQFNGGAWATFLREDANWSGAVMTSSARLFLRLRITEEYFNESYNPDIETKICGHYPKKWCGSNFGFGTSYLKPHATAYWGGHMISTNFDRRPYFYKDHRKTKKAGFQKSMGLWNHLNIENWTPEEKYGYTERRWDHGPNNYLYKGARTGVTGDLCENHTFAHMNTLSRSHRTPKVQDEACEQLCGNSTGCTFGKNRGDQTIVMGHSMGGMIVMAAVSAAYGHKCWKGDFAKIATIASPLLGSMGAAGLHNNICTNNWGHDDIPKLPTIFNVGRRVYNFGWDVFAYLSKGGKWDGHDMATPDILSQMLFSQGFCNDSITGAREGPGSLLVGHQTYLTFPFDKPEIINYKLCGNTPWGAMDIHGNGMKLAGKTLCAMYKSGSAFCMQMKCNIDNTYCGFNGCWNGNNECSNHSGTELYTRARWDRVWHQQNDGAVSKFSCLANGRNGYMAQTGYRETHMSMNHSAIKGVYGNGFHKDKTPLKWIRWAFEQAIVDMN